MTNRWHDCMNNFKKKKSPVEQGKRLVMGRNCVNELLKESPERIVKVFLLNDDPKLQNQLDKHRIPSFIVGKNSLNEMVDSESHQSIVALIKEKPLVTFADYLALSNEKENDLILVLDSIMDPQNFGALLRCAECFGVGAVMWSKNRGVDITPVVSKASVGATELIPTVKVANLVETVKALKNEGYVAITAEVGKEASSLYSFKFPAKTVLIVGSEGEGVRQLLSKQADHKLFIPMKGKIDSLNVSQATSVFLSHWQK